MELTSIQDIFNGMCVFMPSGIQANLKINDEGKIEVIYPNLSKDVYDQKDFESLIGEGIKIFNEPSQMIMENKMNENRIEILGELETIAKTHEDPKVRQYATSLLDALNLQVDAMELADDLIQKVKKQLHEEFQRGYFCVQGPESIHEVFETIEEANSFIEDMCSIEGFNPDQFSITGCGEELDEAEPKLKKTDAKIQTLRTLVKKLTKELEPEPGNVELKAQRDELKAALKKLEDERAVLVGEKPLNEVSKEVADLVVGKREEQLTDAVNKETDYYNRHGRNMQDPEYQKLSNDVYVKSKKLVRSRTLRDNKFGGPEYDEHGNLIQENDRMSRLDQLKEELEGLLSELETNQVNECDDFKCEKEEGKETYVCYGKGVAVRDPQEQEAIRRWKEQVEKQEVKEEFEPKRYIVQIQMNADEWDQQEFDNIAEAVQAFKQLKDDRYSELIDTKNDEILLSNGTLQESLNEDAYDADEEDPNPAGLSNIGLPITAVLEPQGEIEEEKEPVQDIKDTIEDMADSIKDKIEDLEDEVKELKQEVTGEVEEAPSVEPAEEPVEDEEVEEIEEPMEAEEEMEEEEEEEEEEEMMEESLDFKSFLRSGSLELKKDEDLNSTKQEIDKMAREGKDPEQMKAAISMLADDDKEKEEAEKYAAEKLTESLIQKALETGYNATLANLNK